MPRRDVSIPAILAGSKSASFRCLNASLYGGAPVAVEVALYVEKKRLRQQTGDGLNKTERAFYERLQGIHAPDSVHPHGITLRIANGCRYTPDFFVSTPPLRAYEVKGPRMWDDAAVKLKVAAARHRWLKFYLVSYANGAWREQEIFA